ncbi:MAG: (2Fe-2S) ferredoxin domain-containing protein [Bacteroidetes bacterium]|nr:(2Fe-2S) ferredoxin domain-containing protein [Bacteroidota bacterium]
MRYIRHIFICTNKRKEDDPKGSCAQKGSEEIRDIFKKELHARGLKTKVRANKSGCLDVCEHGPNVVIYPEGVWYSHVTKDDVVEIIEKHIIGGKVIERLLLNDPRYKPDKMAYPPMKTQEVKPSVG